MSVRRSASGASAKPLTAKRAATKASIGFAARDTGLVKDGTGGHTIGLSDHQSFEAAETVVPNDSSAPQTKSKTDFAVRNRMVQDDG